MCLMWVLPTRDLLPLLRQKPMLYHRAVQQAVPGMAFDYLAINPIGVRQQPQTNNNLIAHKCQTWHDMVLRKF